jgi:hypothetical protein
MAPLLHEDHLLVVEAHAEYVPVVTEVEKEVARTDLGLAAAATNSSSQVSIRFVLSGPVSSIFCFPTLPHRGSTVVSSLSVAYEWMTPRGPNVSKNFGNSFFDG